MSSGFTHLIELLNDPRDADDLLFAKMISNFHDGVEQEPERLHEVVAACYARINYVMPDMDKKTKVMTSLENIAIFAIISDHGFDELPEAKSKEYYQMFRKYYDNTIRYGPAMKCLATYAGAICR